MPANPESTPKRKRLNVTLLIRRVVNEQAVWLVHSRYTSEAEAADFYERRIRGRGITAWAWWGPTPIAKKMLKDPSYVHGESDVE